MLSACEKGFQEAFEIATALEMRIKKKDKFLKDYEIEIKIAPYPIIGGTNREAAETISDFLALESIPCAIEHISHCHYHHFDDNDNFPKLLVDKTTNWNTDYYNKVFPGIGICYLVHRMIESSVWSAPDILSIRKIWVDVKVAHQYYQSIPR